jgi:hypothetical protein
MTDRKVLSAVEQRPRVINEAIRQLQQAQIADYQPLDELLTEIAALSVDPAADSGLFFDDSESAIKYWTPVAPLSFSGATLVAATASEGAVGAVELATTTEASAGTDTARAVTAAGLTAFAQLKGHAPDVMATEETTSGTDAGTATSGSWFTRVLTTLGRNHGTLASLATGEVTLPAGSYHATWSVPGFFVNRFQSRLQNMTDTTTLALGTSEYNSNGVADGFVTQSLGSCVFTLAASKAIAVQMRVEATRATDGRGRGSNFSVNNIFTRLDITKVA